MVREHSFLRWEVKENQKFVPGRNFSYRQKNLLCDFKILCLGELFERPQDKRPEIEKYNVKLIHSF